MKLLAIVVIVLILVVGFVLVRNRHRSADTLHAARPQTNPYAGLRDMALHSKRESMGIPATAEKGDVWGFLMDWGVENGTATVVAFSDGSASVYLSGGGGYIGGQGKEPIREAAKKAVMIANQDRNLAQLTSSFPLPQKGAVFFYFLTDDGVLAASASEHDLKTQQHGLSRLGNAAQEIITQFRKLQTAS